MNRKKREAAKVRYETQRKSRSAELQQKTELAEKRAAELRAALRKDRGPSCEFARGAAADVLRTKGARLLEAGWDAPLRRLLAVPALRPIEAWEPYGKGRATLFRSLAEHLLARHPTPAIVWNAFHSHHDALVQLARHVADGGSMVEHVKRFFPIPLTRRMCHDVLATPAEVPLLDAIRAVQVRAAGGTDRLFEAWRVTRPAMSIGTKDEEIFWASVVDWLAKVWPIDPDDVAPLVDFIGVRKNREPTFSMKGRSLAAMLRGMHEWHREITRDPHVAGKIFPRSGLSPGEYEDQRREANGYVVKETWRIQEVLTARLLAEEGRRMGHCVYSYAWRIEKGDTSIWSVTMEDGWGDTGNWHMVTVEVRNDIKRVVQARGRFNRSMTPKELRIVTRWAALNGLTMALGRW